VKALITYLLYHLVLLERLCLVLHHGLLHLRLLK
jgi:hypothetical protein